MLKRKRKLGITLAIVCVFLVIGSAAATGTGRISDYRDLVKEDVSVIKSPQYVPGVVYTDLLAQPSAHQLYSWAKDNEGWTAELLDTLRQSSTEVVEIAEFVGDKVLMVFIDFDADIPYAATINLKTGEVVAGYEDTKTEIWMDLHFLQALISYGDNYLEDQMVSFAVEHYYEDWGVWVQRGSFDLMLTRETIQGFLMVGLIMGAGYGGYKFMKKGK